MKIRTGNGYDVHALEEGRDFWLGGVKLEHFKGCIAHSDGDTLIHAICDALLGAAAAGDIGIHFPDSSDEYKNIAGKILLGRVVKLIRSKGYEIGNIDTVVCLQRPKIKDRIPEMIKVLSEVAGISENDLSIKATTTEKIGFVGREEGVAVFASALIYSP